MGERITIAGAGARVGWPADTSLAEAVHGAVGDALAMAGLGSPREVDLVVTVGSDVLDGGMVATGSGIAGAYGRELMTVTSGTGHAVAAALSMIESGAAGSVLVAGWGEGTKFAEIDGRVIQADPFYARPLAADAARMAVLQARRLMDDGAIDPEAMARYGEAMRGRAGIAAAPDGAARWMKTGWCDGAAAIVLAPGRRGVAVRDLGTAFRPYCPEPDDLDPAAWVAAALAAMRVPDALADLRLTVIEAGGPTPFCEARALAPLLAGPGWALSDARVNPSGGGAVAYFGAATGLLRIVAAARELAGGRTFAEPAGGVVVELAGPIGQATSVIVLDAMGGTP